MPLTMGSDPTAGKRGKPAVGESLLHIRAVSLDIFHDLFMRIIIAITFMTVA
jgi:hypothetical protein